MLPLSIMPSAELCDVCLFQLNYQVLNFGMFVSALLPSAELWYDCVIGTDDLERADGCYRQWISHRGGAQVTFRIFFFFLFFC